MARNVTVTLDKNEVSFKATKITQHFMLRPPNEPLIEEGDIPLGFPAIITEDNTLLIMINKNFGYSDYTSYKLIVRSAGAVPLAVLSMEKYYTAHEQGLLTDLWEK